MNILGLPFWQVSDRAEAMARYDEWLRTLPANQTAQYQPLVTAVRNWRQEIFAFFDSGVTNGVTEALNGLVKNANRNGRGYTFDVIRAKVVLGTGLKAEKRPRFGDEWKADDRVAEAPATYVQGELEFPSPQEQSWDNLIFLCVTHHSQDHVSGFHTEAFSISDLFSTGESE